MSLCATYNATGQVTILQPQPADTSTCSLMIPTSDDGMNIFKLSAEDGTAIAFAIVTVWCVGFASRAVIRLLNTL